MYFTPAETEKLLLSVVAIVARDRLERGILLNHPEAVALPSCWVIEWAREGRGVADLMQEGRTVLSGACHHASAPDVAAEYLQGYSASAEYPESVIDDIKKRALHRTKILEGQLRGIEKMIENEDYCVDIITLSLAVQKSLGSLNKLLVENHLRTHVTDMYESGGDERDAAVAELIRIFELSNNRG